MEEKKVKKVIKDHYGRIASTTSGCCSSCGCGKSTSEQIATSIGYTKGEIDSAPTANLGLGCGNPTATAGIKEGDTVLDLGSGAGFDCFLAAKKVGDTGKVIGVDFSEEMVSKAEENAKQLGCKNVEFRLGDIEELPIDDHSVDVIISNCVINLAPDKAKVFAESFRVIKPGGKMFVSDIVLLQNIPEKTKNDEELLAGCVGGAILKQKYLDIVKAAGFKVEILSEDKDISKRQYQGIPLESLKIKATIS